MKRRGETGLFAGVREVADRALGVSDYASTSAALSLSKRGYPAETATLVRDLFEVINRNWIIAVRGDQRSTSQENFRWHCPQTKFADHNKSPEVTLERAFVCALRDAGRKDWSNQIPLISGIAGPRAFKKCAVDLVHRKGESSFEFVELKVNSNTPVHAAVEILVYGLLWLLSRRDREALGYAAGPILGARELALSVLAPRGYYNRYSVELMASAINEGLDELSERHGVTMGFGFTAFPASFSWPRDSGKPPKPDDEELIALLDAREAV
jgi:hypothetical protein